MGLDWRDLRYFLAIARAGTLAGAARELGVEHSTVSRRLTALEEELGSRLFDRTPDGYVLTAAGTDILPRAQDAERAIEDIQRRAGGEDARLAGTVKVATSEGFAGFLVKGLAGLRERHPDIVIEVLSGNRNVDLTRREADLAVRLAATTQPDLTIRKLADLGWSMYAAEGYVARAGLPPSPRELAGHDLVGFDDSMAGVPGAQWLAAHGAGARVVFRANSLIAALNAITTGMGISVLPCFLAAGEPTLRRLSAEVLANREAFLVFHPDVGRIARVRAVMDYLVDLLARNRDLLRG